jgi:hypothetical protein
VLIRLASDAGRHPSTKILTPIMDAARRNMGGSSPVIENSLRQKIVQIELSKTVAARPTAAFEVVADVADWPQIIGSAHSALVSARPAATPHVTNAPP